MACQQVTGGAWLQQPLFWLHFPKCGSSFRISTAAYRWSSDRLVAVNHQPVGSHTRLDEVVALFREPRSRMLSAYAWIHQVRGKCCEDWGWDASATHADVSQRIVLGEPPSETIARFTGCQANMLLGHGCMSQASLSQSEVARAADAVGRIKFVGLVAQWKLSMCLFNYLMTKERFVLREQLLNTQPTNDSSTSRYSGFDVSDPVDELIFRIASLRFARELSSFDISEGTCVVLPSNATRYPCGPGGVLPDVVADAGRVRPHGMGRLGGRFVG